MTFNPEKKLEILTFLWKYLISKIRSRPSSVQLIFFRFCCHGILLDLSTWRPRPLASCEKIVQWGLDFWLDRLEKCNLERLELTDASIADIEQEFNYIIVFYRFILDEDWKDAYHKAIHNNELFNARIELYYLFRIDEVVSEEPILRRSDEPIIPEILLVSFGEGNNLDAQFEGDDTESTTSLETYFTDLSED